MEGFNCLDRLFINPIWVFFFKNFFQDVYLVSNNASAKEKEALSFVSIRMTDSCLPNDLPPSYEEIANLQVRLEPVHQNPTEEETKSTKI